MRGRRRAPGWVWQRSDGRRGASRGVGAGVGVPEVVGDGRVGSGGRPGTGRGGVGGGRTVPVRFVGTPVEFCLGMVNLDGEGGDW